ncbi:MAG: multiheme c-type cytochrome, partial [Planctomycetota bacterium]
MTDAVVDTDSSAKTDLGNDDQLEKVAPRKSIDLTRPAIRVAADRKPSSLVDGDPTPQRDGESVAMAAPVPNAMAALGPEDHQQWPTPDVTLFVTGQQHGYIEPCGCTGLENQKGGVARRMTLMDQLKSNGWNLVPIDAGNLIRRTGKQAEIKFHRSLEALRTMKYRAVGFGPDDLRISSSDLLLEAADDGDPDRSIYASANVVLYDPSFMPSQQIIRQSGLTIGVTSVLDPAAITSAMSDDIQVLPPIDATKQALQRIRAESPDFTVLTFFGEEDAAADLVRAIDGFDLVVVAGGYGEPTYQPQPIEGSQTRMILTGSKGMYAGLVGLYRDAPMRYARVAMTHEFEDAPAMRQLMAEYQNQLKNLGLEGLGLEPIPHPSGIAFTGSEACGKCHTTAYDVWEFSMHFEATEHLVHPGERSDVARHFDPECLSCH